MSAAHIMAEVDTDTGPRTIHLEGRMAWAFAQLIQAGPAGCTPLSHPGPRWSAHVHKLRQAGITIKTIHERHDGQFAGHHGRYVLVSPVRLILDDRRAA